MCETVMMMRMMVCIMAADALRALLSDGCAVNNEQRTERPTHNLCVCVCMLCNGHMIGTNSRRGFAAKRRVNRGTEIDGDRSEHGRRRRSTCAVYCTYTHTHMHTRSSVFISREKHESCEALLISPLLSVFIQSLSAINGGGA